MKTGDLVRFVNRQLRGGCLPSVKDNRSTACGLVLRGSDRDGNVNILWPERGQELVAAYFLEVINEISYETR
jgi:hypothetical protein